MDRLEEIKARCEAATPGPWTVQFDDLDLTGIRVANGKKMTEDDIWFIAHSQRDIPWLIEEVERLRESLDMWERLPVKIEHEPMSKIASRQHVVLKDVLNTLKGTAFNGREILEAKINQALNMYSSTE